MYCSEILLLLNIIECKFLAERESKTKLNRHSKISCHYYKLITVIVQKPDKKNLGSLYYTKHCQPIKLSYNS